MTAAGRLGAVLVANVVRLGDGGREGLQKSVLRTEGNQIPGFSVSPARRALPGIMLYPSRGRIIPHQIGGGQARQAQPGAGFQDATGHNIL